MLYFFLFFLALPWVILALNARVFSKIVQFPYGEAFYNNIAEPLHFALCNCAEKIAPKNSKDSANKEKNNLNKGKIQPEKEIKVEDEDEF